MLERPGAAAPASGAEAEVDRGAGHVNPADFPSQDHTGALPHSVGPPGPGRTSAPLRDASLPDGMVVLGPRMEPHLNSEDV